MLNSNQRAIFFLYDWLNNETSHDYVIKWKHFPRYWSFVRRIHRSTVNSPRKGQWRGALMFSLIFAWTNGWVNNRETADLRRHRAHYDVTVMRCHDHSMSSQNVIRIWIIVWSTWIYKLFRWCNKRDTAEFGNRVLTIILIGQRLEFLSGKLS